MASWNTPLPNIPETDYGPAFEPTIIAAIKELRAAIDGHDHAGRPDR